jgi:hypothetical protein
MSRKTFLQIKKFFLSAFIHLDPDTVPASQTNADPDPKLCSSNIKCDTFLLQVESTERAIAEVNGSLVSGVQLKVYFILPFHSCALGGGGGGGE